jgi:bleomycin hydrolase
MGSISSKPSLPTSPESEKAGLSFEHGGLHDQLATLSLSRKPVSPEGTVTISQLKEWEAKVTDDPKLRLTRTILTHTAIPNALAKSSRAVANPHVFNLNLDFETEPITNQKSSGRCWLFATTNVLRYSVMKKLNLENFQLSQVGLSLYHQ